MRFFHVAFLALVGIPPLIGCQMFAASSGLRLARNVSGAVLNQDDPELVREGAPAYLIAIDGLIEADPKDPELLLAGAKLYTAYASAFVTEPERARRLTLRAYRYGKSALCLRKPALCEAVNGPFETFAQQLATTNTRDLPTLYGFGSAWASWIRANSSDWNAIAELPKVQLLMERVLELDETYDTGGAHLYLGVLYTLRPAGLGGQPELGRSHFERAIELSKGRNLTAKVLFASQYARLVFDRPLHDRLLQEVIDADPKAPGFTLGNVLAQEQARALLASADAYF